MDRPPSRLGLWGVFDVEDLGHAVYLQVVRAELAARLPGAHVRVFSPSGAPTRGDRGEPSEALDASLDGLDVVVIGGHGLAEVPELVAPVPGARWHVTSTDDEAALRNAGVMGTVDVTPHLAVLLPRLLSAQVLAKRLEYLRMMGWYPSGDALVVDDSVDASTVRAVLDDHPGLTLTRLPPTLSTEDVCAALAAADGYVGPEEAACAIALAYGRPAVRLTADAAHDPESVAAAFAQAVKSPPKVEPLQAEVDAWLDSVAAEVPDAGDDPATVAALESELRALRVAYRVRAQRANAERVLLADRAARTDAELAALRAEVEELRRIHAAEAEAHARFEAEVVALKETRAFRWTAAARSLYRRLR